MKKYQIIAWTGLFFPFLAFAANTSGDLTGVINVIGGLISLVTPIVVALALLYFFWGLAKFILSTGGGKEQEEAKGIMLWGIIALFVMVSIWGIIRVVSATFLGGVNYDSIPIDSILIGSGGSNNPLGN